MKIITLIIIVLFSFCAFSQEKNKETQLNNSNIAFTINEKDLLPENIAYDPLKENFYMGSTRKGKILKINKKGEVEDFIEARQNGLWMVIGMKVDSKRKILWACSSGGGNLIKYDRDDKTNGRPAGIFKFDLKTGKLIKKFILDDNKEVHFFNDIVIHENGDVYITHMFNKASIYKITNQSDKLELFFEDPELKYPNGISISKDNQWIFFAYSGGIGKLNIQNKSWQNISIPENLSITKNEGIDGLYYYKNSLVCVKSFSKKVEILYLNENEDKIVNHKTLEKNHPMMNRPTTGVIKGNEFYYVANSQFDSFSEEGKLYPKDQLYEIAVLKVKLD